MTFAGLRVEYKADGRDFIRETKKVRKEAAGASKDFANLDRQIREKNQKSFDRLTKRSKVLSGQLESMSPKIGSAMNAFRGLGSAMKALGPMGAIVGGALGAATASTVIAAKRVNELGEEYRKLSQRAKQFGVDQTSLGGLTSMFSKRGISEDTTIDAVQTILERTQEALEGQQTQVDLFQKLKINAEQFAKLPLEEKMRKLAEAFSKMENSSDRTLASTDLMGDEAAKIAGEFGNAAKFAEDLRKSIRAKEVQDFLGRRGAETAAKSRERATSRQRDLDTFIIGTYGDRIGEGLSRDLDFAAKEVKRFAVAIGVWSSIEAEANRRLEGEKKIREAEAEGRASDAARGEVIRRNMRRGIKATPAPTAKQTFRMGEFRIQGGAGGVLSGLTSRKQEEENARRQMEGSNALGVNFTQIGFGIGQAVNKAMSRGSDQGGGFTQRAQQSFGFMGAGPGEQFVREAGLRDEKEVEKKQLTELEQIKKLLSPGADTIGKAAQSTGDFFMKTWTGLIGG